MTTVQSKSLIRNLKRDEIRLIGNKSNLPTKNPTNWKPENLVNRQDNPLHVAEIRGYLLHDDVEEVLLDKIAIKISWLFMGL